VSSCNVVTMTSIAMQTTDVRGMSVLQSKLMIETPFILKYRILLKYNSEGLTDGRLPA
jgi:hypothetical protein